MKIDEIKTKIDELVKSFNEDHEKAVKGNKSAAVRARKATLNLEKELKEYRKASLAGSDE